MTAEQLQQTLDRRQVRQHFSCHAGEYNRYAQVQQRVVARLVDLLKDASHPLEMGLEVGCGTGLLSSRFQSTFPEASLVLSDIAHGMSCQSRKVLPNNPVCDADAAALPFVVDCFDFLLSSSVYQWIEDLSGAFDEVGRVLQQDGLFGLALFGEHTLHELRSSHQRALQDRNSHGQSFPSIQRVEEALRGKFVIEELISEDEIEWHKDVPDLLRCLKKIGAQNSTTARPKGLASRSVMQSMCEHYRTSFGDERGIPATYQVIYLLARKK